MENPYCSCKLTRVGYMQAGLCRTARGRCRSQSGRAASSAAGRDSVRRQCRPKEMALLGGLDRVASSLWSRCRPGYRAQAPARPKEMTGQQIRQAVAMTAALRAARRDRLFPNRVPRRRDRPPEGGERPDAVCSHWAPRGEEPRPTAAAPTMENPCCGCRLNTYSCSPCGDPLLRL